MEWNEKNERGTERTYPLGIASWAMSDRKIPSPIPSKFLHKNSHKTRTGKFDMARPKFTVDP